MPTLLSLIDEQMFSWVLANTLRRRLLTWATGMNGNLLQCPSLSRMKHHHHYAPKQNCRTVQQTTVASVHEVDQKGARINLNSQMAQSDRFLERMSSYHLSLQGIMLYIICICPDAELRRQLD